MTLKQPDTERLVRKAQQGDSSAVRDLLARHRNRLTRMVMVHMDPRMASRLDASDVVQEALADAAQRLPEYLHSRPVAFYPWLRQIAWQRLVDMHRRHLHSQRRALSREEQPTLVPDASVADLAQRLIASQPSPSNYLIHAELRQRVRDGLERLAYSDRELLLMRHVEELRVTEIAAALKISERATKSRLRRALERLHRALGTDFFGGVDDEQES